MTNLPHFAADLRAASPADAEALARLSTELGYPATAAQIRARLGELTGKRGHLILVACRGNAVCGWIHVEHRLLLEAGEYAEIMGLVVASEARRSGLGKRLVEAAESWAARRGLETVRVRSNVVRIESHPFYRALGYEPVKAQNVYTKALGSGS